MDYSKFRENLRYLIEARGMGITVFSEKIGIPTATISRYLSGNRTPDLPYVIRIATFFSVSIDWLLGLNGDKFEILPQEIQDMARCYQLASLDDRRVVQAVLNKYQKEN